MVSLNSAIEVARAGKHDRGYAIVSQEIRKLSVQTMADKVQTMLSDSNQYNVQVEEFPKASIGCCIL